MPPRQLSPRAVAVLGSSALAVVVAVGVVLSASGSLPGAGGPVPTPAPTPVAQVALVHRGVVPWDRPLTVTATDGTITSVSATGPDGTPLSGTLTAAGWRSTQTLVPSAQYVLHVRLRSAQGRSSSYDRTVTTAPPALVLRASVAQTGGLYGVGEAVIVRFNHAVNGTDARRAVVARLSVTSSPPVQGAWHWFNSYEVHYRGPAYWTTGTTVQVRADLSGLRLPGSGTWGASEPATGGMTIGDSLIATVDVTAHTMTVRRNGVVVRVVKVSTGRDKYPTKGGVHVVLVREKEHLYDSATVGIPTASPDGYYETLPWSVRISNGGAFVHANPATVRFQGRLNVSHGCVNASVADAKWFYDNTHLGDVVDVVHAAVGPTLWDEGMADWNYTWAQWQQGAA